MQFVGITSLKLNLWHFEETLKVSNEITDSLKTIFALSENYPDLKANENFLKLQEELTNTENKIAYSRQLWA